VSPPAENVDKPVAGLHPRPQGPRPARRQRSSGWGSEFGRTPSETAEPQRAPSRDHNPSRLLLARRRRLRARLRLQARPNDVGIDFAVENPGPRAPTCTRPSCTSLGLESTTRLTYRHAGRDFRLTDVHGQVVKPLLA
jgi:hypothetical protein